MWNQQGAGGNISQSWTDLLEFLVFWVSTSVAGRTWLRGNQPIWKEFTQIGQWLLVKDRYSLCYAVDRYTTWHPSLLARESSLLSWTIDVYRLFSLDNLPKWSPTIQSKQHHPCRKEWKGERSLSYGELWGGVDRLLIAERWCCQCRSMRRNEQRFKSQVSGVSEDHARIRTSNVRCRQWGRSPVDRCRFGRIANFHLAVYSDRPRRRRRRTRIGLTDLLWNTQRLIEKHTVMTSPADMANSSGRSGA